MKKLIFVVAFVASALAIDRKDNNVHFENNNGNKIEETVVPTEQSVKNEKFWEENCFDLYGTAKCEVLRDEWGFCKSAKTNRMDEMCRKTCGFCRQNADCSKGRFQCCPDGITMKADRKGSNCPGCKDKHPLLCKDYEKDCNNFGWAGQWMHRNCKKTCGFCKEIKPVCTDDKYQKDFCPSWKEYGMCRIHGELMKKYCKATCGFCGAETSKGNEWATEKSQKVNEKKEIFPVKYTS